MAFAPYLSIVMFYALIIVAAILLTAPWVVALAYFANKYLSIDKELILIGYGYFISLALFAFIGFTNLMAQGGYPWAL